MDIRRLTCVGVHRLMSVWGYDLWSWGVYLDGKLDLICNVLFDSVYVTFRCVCRCSTSYYLWWSFTRDICTLHTSLFFSSWIVDKNVARINSSLLYIESRRACPSSDAQSTAIVMIQYSACHYATMYKHDYPKQPNMPQPRAQKRKGIVQQEVVIYRTREESWEGPITPGNTYRRLLLLFIFVQRANTSCVQRTFDRFAPVPEIFSHKCPHHVECRDGRITAPKSLMPFPRSAAP
jgi:hypothetical protein